MKKKKTDLPTRGISIVDRVTFEVTREGTGQYDGDDTQEYHDIRGFKVEASGSYGDFFIKGEPKDTYYLVYVTYSTGDSFHHESGCVCYAFFSESFEECTKVKGAILAHAEKEREHKPSDYRIDVKFKDRTEVIESSAWTGYFEHIESVDIVPVMRIG